MTRASPSRTSFSATSRRAASACASASASAARSVGIVEPREHLALVDGHPFLDVHLDDLAGDFRRHGRAASRRDVARCVQHRRLGAGGPFGRSRSLDLDWPFPVRPHPGPRADDGKDDESERPLQPTAHTGSFWRTLDAKRGQVFFQILHRPSV